ncbi:MAG: hypothetical protein N3A38_06960 [Planctomycetota bacterium]|nr:hypothetical protein [Planctomycetota bacterium]
MMNTGAGGGNNESGPAGGISDPEKERKTRKLEETAGGGGCAPFRPGLARWAWIAGFLAGGAIEAARCIPAAMSGGGAAVPPGLYEAYWPDGEWLAGLWIANGLILGACGGGFLPAMLGAVFCGIGGAVFASTRNVFLKPPHVLARWVLLCVPGAIAGAGTGYARGMRGGSLWRAAFWGAAAVLVGLGVERIFVLAAHPVALYLAGAGSAGFGSAIMEVLDTAVNNAALVGFLGADLEKLHARGTSEGIRVIGAATLPKSSSATTKGSRS